MSDFAGQLVGEGASPHANDERGEDELRLGRQRYRLRPSYAAIKTAEKKTGLSLLEMVRGGHVGGLSIGQLESIAGEFIRAGAEDELAKHVMDERIGELMLESGIGPATSALTLLLVDAARGGRTASGERKPVAENAAS